MGTKLEIIAEPGKTDFSFRRTFAAPLALVWRAMTEAEHVAKWYGPRSTRLVRCDIDFRVGGTWRFVMRAPTGEEAAFSGEYLEIVPEQKVRQTWRFEAMVGAQSVETLTFESQGDRTIIHGHVQHATPEMRDGHLGAMEPGASETWDRLEELVAAMSS